MVVKKNDKYEIEIISQAHDGVGIGKINGMTIFCPDMLPGEKGEILIIKVNKSYAISKMLSISTSSPNRILPLCSSYNTCGGCSLGYMSYSSQLSFKQNHVKECLERIGGIKNPLINKILSMENSFHYRNKAQYPLGNDKSGCAVSGFYSRRSHRITDVTNCLIQDDATEQIRKFITTFINENSISIYNEETHSGLFRSIMLRKSFFSGDIMLVLCMNCNSTSFPWLDSLISALHESFNSVKSLYLNVNEERTNVVLGETFVHIFGEKKLLDKIGDTIFYISPQSFYQVNPVQTKVLYDEVARLATLTPNDVVLDLYCGIGTIGLYLASQVKMLYGIELIPQAIVDAHENAILNNIQNAEFFCGDAGTVTDELLLNSHFKPDVVIIDPPRKGCDQATLDAIVKISPSRIVYVSCNPSTLARDLKFLCGEGFNLSEVQPVDMFPWTEHVEAIVKMTRMQK